MAGVQGVGLVHRHHEPSAGQRPDVFADTVSLDLAALQPIGVCPGNLSILSHFFSPGLSFPQANLAYVLNVSDSGPVFHQLDLKLADLLLPRFRALERQRVYRFHKLAEEKAVAKKTWGRKKKKPSQ